MSLLYPEKREQANRQQHTHTHTGASGSAPAEQSGASIPVTEITDDDQPEIPLDSDSPDTPIDPNSLPADVPLDPASTISPPGNTQSPYQNIKLNPGLYNTPNKEQLNKQLGKASNIEAAYDNLENVIGTNNIRSMSGDTQNLIKQQTAMLKQLKEITPALNQAMESVGKIDLGGISEMFGKFTQNFSTTK